MIRCFARAAHFFVQFLAVELFCTSKTGNFFSLPNYIFYGGNVRVPVQFVFS